MRVDPKAVEFLRIQGEQNIQARDRAMATSDALAADVASIYDAPQTPGFNTATAPLGPQGIGATAQGLVGGLQSDLSGYQAGYQTDLDAYLATASGLQATGYDSVDYARSIWEQEKQILEREAAVDTARRSAGGSGGGVEAGSPWGAWNSRTAAETELAGAAYNAMAVDQGTVEDNMEIRLREGRAEIEAGIKSGGITPREAFQMVNDLPGAIIEEGKRQKAFRELRAIDSAQIVPGANEYEVPWADLTPELLMGLGMTDEAEMLAAAAPPVQDTSRPEFWEPQYERPGPEPTWPIAAPMSGMAQIPGGELIDGELISTDELAALMGQRDQMETARSAYEDAIADGNALEEDTAASQAHWEALDAGLPMEEYARRAAGLMGINENMAMGMFPNDPQELMDRQIAYREQLYQEQSATGAKDPIEEIENEATVAESQDTAALLEASSFSGFDVSELKSASDSTVKSSTATNAFVAGPWWNEIVDPWVQELVRNNGPEQALELLASEATFGDQAHGNLWGQLAADGRLSGEAASTTGLERLIAELYSTRISSFD